MPGVHIQEMRVQHLTFTLVKETTEQPYLRDLNFTINQYQYVKFKSIQSEQEQKMSRLLAPVHPTHHPGSPTQNC